MMKVLDIKGLDGHEAAMVFHKLMFGLHMVPAYFNDSYKDFFDKIDQMPEDDQLKVIREAAALVELLPSEKLALMKFAVDNNGVKYSMENCSSLPPKDINEIIVKVCWQLAKDHSANFLTESEKKN